MDMFSYTMGLVTAAAAVLMNYALSSTYRKIKAKVYYVDAKNRSIYYTIVFAMNILFIVFIFQTI